MQHHCHYQPNDVYIDSKILYTIDDHSESFLTIIMKRQYTSILFMHNRGCMSNIILCLINVSHHD